jgi:hypothetical protein
MVQGGNALPPGDYTRTATIGSRPVSDLVDPGRVMDLYAAGATIVLQGLQRSWAPVRAFCRELEVALTHAVQANAYLTPPGAQGLRVHHDTHDVFALQTHGRKHWVVYEPHVEAPIPGQGWSADVAPTPPVLDVTLQPGDALYVPRGAPHAAATVDEPSLHLTIGIVATTWHDLLKSLLDRAAQEPSFRAALPVGWADQPADAAPQAKEALLRLAGWIAEQDADELLDSAASRFWSARLPPLRGQLQQLMALDAVTDVTAVAPRPHAVARISATATAVTLRLGDRVVSLPAWVQPAIERLLAGEHRVGELADLLDDGSRQVLVRRLVREGALVVLDT